MTNTATRLITLIMLLEHRPNQKASELAERLGVSVRTLHRYIGMLDELGIPIYSERGPQGGFSLVRGYKMPPLIFTPSEAAALCLGTGLVADLWGQLYSEPAQSALAKLENILPDEQLSEVEWARRALVNTPLPNPRLQSFAPRLEALRRALRDRHRVRLVYQSGNQSEIQEREFDPYALAYRAGWWYVIGYCHLREAVRSFRVDRIHQLDVLTMPYQIPADFDAQAYLAFEVEAEKGVPLRMHLTAEFAYLATSTPAFWENLDMQPDGSVIVTTRMIDIYRAAGFVFSYGPAATVLEPKELQDMMRTWAAELIKLYDELPNH
ncbi:MAG: YafY family transcriptional regulator [Anaerolineae bacterium]|nr:YafY family transcriptional regulator [Anaerolineae bacterium]